MSKKLLWDEIPHRLCKNRKIKLALVTVAFRAVYDFIFLSFHLKSEHEILTSYLLIVMLSLFASLRFASSEKQQNKLFANLCCLMCCFFFYLSLVPAFTRMFLFCFKYLARFIQEFVKEKMEIQRCTWANCNRIPNPTKSDSKRNNGGLKIDWEWMLLQKLVA